LKYAKVGIILLVVLYRCGTWFLVMMLEKGGAEENIWTKGVEVTAVWRKLHNEELVKY
jgi:hypothetical protein